MEIIGLKNAAEDVVCLRIGTDNTYELHQFDLEIYKEVGQ